MGGFCMCMCTKNSKLIWLFVLLFSLGTIGAVSWIIKNSLRIIKEASRTAWRTAITQRIIDISVVVVLTAVEFQIDAIGIWE